MNYITIKDASKLWNISERRIRKLIQDKRIEGAIKVGTTWNIPKESTKPIDKRIKLEENDFIIDIPKNFFEKIDKKKKILDSKRSLPRETINSLMENTILEWTYNSNAIEGNTLTLIETKVVLEGITIGGKSMREHLEVINHREAIKYLEELVKQKNMLSEFDIRSIHRLVLKYIDDRIAGVYRTGQVIISGATHIPPEGIFVNEKMEQLVLKYTKWCDKYHPLVVCALLHGEFVKIHPFEDGNGRTARLLMNFEAIKYGFTPIIIKNDIRKDYYLAIDKAVTTSNYTDFIKLIAKSCEESLDLYLKVIK
ncbi:MAG: Fic family protein [Clostridia bacterium]